MNARLTVAILAAAGIQAALAGQKEPRPAARAPKPAAQAHPNAGAGQAGPAKAPGPGIENVRRLAQMSPQARQKALESLPPERRQAVMKQLQDFQRMSPAERQRATIELERLQRLPQPRQNQVRRSLVQFKDLPEERKAIVGSELDRLSAMPEQERRARMNSEEFRNRYSPAEQQMMSNISEVLPPQEQ